MFGFECSELDEYIANNKREVSTRIKDLSLFGKLVLL
jgi:hypothetical protein